jgi:SHS2 domain-containing protein
MKKYEILEHTADIQIRAFGRSKQDVFKNAMLGMQESLYPKIKNKKTGTKIKIDSENLESLLVDFLSEINYLNEVNLEVYNRVVFDKFSDTELEAELSGNKVERFGLQIKGITFHDLEIKQKEDGTWQATVLFDV